MSTKHYITYKRYEERHGIGEYKQKGAFVSQDTIDAAADLKFSGGYNLKRKNKCPVCHTFRSTSGTCMCE